MTALRSLPARLQTGPFAGWRLITLGALVLLAIAAWAITGVRMEGMNEGPGTDLGTLGFYLTSWVVMMAAMMFPSVAPLVDVYAGLQRGRRAKSMSAPAGATSALVTGYLVTWTAAGLAAFGLFVAGRALVGHQLAWEAGGRWLAAGVLLGAAAYEFTPLKYACLTRCRGPLSFIIESWRDGRVGALRMGIEHGAWCVGCCWALMAALFALGVMSIAWMVVVALLIAVEKLLPWRRAATGAVAGVLVVLAIGVAAAPDRVPALIVPSHGGAGPGMSTDMQMRR
jgi:predicted metal-binding membrane protein